MLRSAKTDALRTEFRSTLCVLRSIGIGSYAKSLILVGKLHYSAEVTAVGVCGNGFNCNGIDITGGTVKRDFATLFKDFSAELKPFLVLVHLDVATTGNTAGSHTTGNNGSVRSLSATNG